MREKESLEGGCTQQSAGSTSAECVSEQTASPVASAMQAGQCKSPLVYAVDCKLLWHEVVLAAHVRLVWVRYLSEALSAGWLGHSGCVEAAYRGSYTCSGFASLQMTA